MTEDRVLGLLSVRISPLLEVIFEAPCDVFVVRICVVLIEVFVVVFDELIDELPGRLLDMVVDGLLTGLFDVVLEESLDVFLPLMSSMSDCIRVGAATCNTVWASSRMRRPLRAALIGRLCTMRTCSSQ